MPGNPAGSRLRIPYRPVPLPAQPAPAPARPAAAGLRRALNRSPAVAEAVDTAVVGAGAAGLFTALVAAEQGARVALVSRSPLAQSASYWAQGGLAAAIGPDDEVALHVEDTLAAGRGTCSAEAVRHPLRARHPTACASSRSAASRSTARRTGRCTCPWKGAQTAARGACRRQRDRPPPDGAPVSELVAAHPRIEVHERSSALALWVDDDRCVGVVTDAGRRPGARDRPGHRRRRSAVEPHDQPERRGRRRPVPRAGGGCGARGPRADAVPPDGPQDPRRARRFPGDRGRARRGRAARRCRGRALRRRARSAGRGGPGDRRAAARRRGGVPRHAGHRHDPLSQHRRSAWPRAALDPRAT